MTSKAKLDGIMVLVSANQIYNVVCNLIMLKIPLFIEKPPGLNLKQSQKLANLSLKYDLKNMVGFNRRYYSHFHKGIKIIEDSGGLLGISVTGHERFWNIATNTFDEKIKQNWIFANSTHTIDLLRFFGGKIIKQHSFSNSIEHKNNDQFVTSIKFKSGALGTYTSHWYSPGGWSVILYGYGKTVTFKPLEEGYWNDRDMNTFSIEPDSVDLKYKQGFHGQLRGFINLINNGKLDWPGVDLNEAFKTMSLAKKIKRTLRNCQISITC